jgi:hypothetical protein
MESFGDCGYNGGEVGVEGDAGADDVEDDVFCHFSR